ncbi:MAG TPA: hypothetical protein PK864_04630 [Syntrophorhabdaceae bacterium]|nr:hypothetical protein [Syntrophorhabdaceae bacterium]HOL05703.1 hypothetical protein [Syntrophorhabdaceae bacterium]HON85297.1 hypothetical protein [Syntrophorhabdaceae bacterium]HPP42269.1 hypothetical protein [Syntrophorhabdaceae bacterium]HQH42528.1 hypothetical protein [Syntrophorhabdaceae bacterium]
MTTFEVGSVTARGGFANEKAVCRKFNNWKEDEDARLWLKVMGYNLDKIDSVEAIHIPSRIKREDVATLGLNENFEDLMRFKKADAQIRITVRLGGVISVENISLKKANSDADYNQVDKRWVDTYKEIWRFDENVRLALKLFTGEINPSLKSNILKNINPRDNRRIFLDELPDDLKNKVITFFENNKILVVSDIIKGRGGLSANWMLVTRYNRDDSTTSWILKDINTVMNFFGTGEVKISPRGSLYIGRITMQRKGGTPDPTKLQFKIKPCDLFKIEIN